MLRDMMKYCLCFLLAGLSAACAVDETEGPGPNPEPAGVTVRLVAEKAPIIETRTASSDMYADDSRIDRVVLYAFDATSGVLKTMFQQNLDYPDNTVRMVLPTGTDLELHAVCNVSDDWFTTSVGNRSDLEAKILTLSAADGVFKGSLVMHGTAAVKAAQVAAAGTALDLHVTRLAARIDMTVVFAPDVSGDRFFLSQIVASNVPAKSYLKARTWSSDYTSAQSDAVYDAVSSTEEIAGANYLHGYRLPYSATTVGGKPGYYTVFYMYENRRGGLDDSQDWFPWITDSNPNKAQLQQIFKAQYGKERFPLGTYVSVEGTYISADGTTSDAKYRIYLGADNDKDFNVKRNTAYKYTVRIKSCDELDTRVEATPLTDVTLVPAFANPLDAHFNSVRCFAFSANDWELYVENPDQTPWLEVSFSPAYKPRVAGDPSSRDRVASAVEGIGALSGNIYIHTDEYIPAVTDEGANKWDASAFRAGYVILKDKVSGTSYRLEVRQRPAQYVKMPVYNGAGTVESYDEYYVEYELERKNMEWGFFMYPANPVMTALINERRDGLSNTLKLYEEAVRIDGMYNYDNADPATVSVPEEVALGYAIAKNRDLDGSGRIDPDEIVWYLPALDELAELRRVLNDGHLAFENTGDNFYSSTPYLSGETVENPGRAFYVNMATGERAFMMRNHLGNVICCRRK